MTKEERKEYMAEQCATHNCSDKTAKLHSEQFVNRHWHPHPNSLFKAWWEPQGFSTNGASFGGHREAFRCWVRLEDKERRWYGIKTEQAWNTEYYRDEFRQWVQDGMNPEHHNWDSTTASQQKVRDAILTAFVELGIPYPS